MKTLIDKQTDLRFWDSFDECMRALASRADESWLPSQWWDMPLIGRAQSLLDDVRKSRINNGFDKKTIEHAALKGLFVCEKRPTNFPESLAKRIQRLRILVQQKGNDYNAGNISILDYWILGSASVFHEIHKRALRMVSLGHSEKTPEFEGLSESGLDLAAFSIFLLALERVSPSSKIS
jgi:hypothetical protein